MKQFYKTLLVILAFGVIIFMVNYFGNYGS